MPASRIAISITYPEIADGLTVLLNNDYARKKIVSSKTALECLVNGSSKYLESGYNETIMWLIDKEWDTIKNKSYFLDALKGSKSYIVTTLQNSYPTKYAEYQTIIANS